MLDNNLDYKEIIVGIIIFAIICVMVYYTTRFLSAKSAGFMQSKYIKIVDRLIISKDKSFYVLQIGTQYFLAASSGQALTISDALEIDELVENEPANTGLLKAQFFNSISDTVKALIGKASDFKNREAQNPNNIDELIYKVQKRSEMLKEANDAVTQKGQF